MTAIRPDEKNSEKKQENLTASLAELGLADYATFLEQILGYNSGGAGLPKHQESWADFLQDNDFALLVSPACHGKTIVGAIGMTPWELARDRQCRIGIMCGGDNLAEDIMSEIKGHLEENERLINLYGKFKPDKPSKWNKAEVRVEGGGLALRQKDSSIFVGSHKANWKGKRLDRIFGDDIVTPHNSDTYDKCRQVIEWFWETANTRLEPWGKIKLVGTPENENDLYHDLMRNPRQFKIRHDKAIIDDQTKKVLWPEKWTYDILAQRRADNYVAFMKHYQTTVVNAEAAKISQDQIDRCYDAREILHPMNLTPEFRSKFKYILMGVDPAWTKNKRSKFSVVTTVGVKKGIGPKNEGDNDRQIIDISRQQVEYDELFSLIKSKYQQLLPTLVIVETNQLQERLRQELVRDAIPTKACFTTGAKNDLLMGIPMLYSLIIANKIILPTGDNASRDLSRQFINELLSWPNGEFSDILMSYYFVEQEIRQRTVEVKVINESAITGRPRGTSRFGRNYNL